MGCFLCELRVLCADFMAMKADYIGLLLMAQACVRHPALVTLVATRN
jgi:hypothetical protein